MVHGHCHAPHTECITITDAVSLNAEIVHATAAAGRKHVLLILVGILPPPLSTTLLGEPSWHIESGEDEKKYSEKYWWHINDQLQWQ